MSELDEEVVSLLNRIADRVATVLGEGVVIAIDVVETSLVDEGTGASATVSGIDNLNILSEEEVKILSPSCDVLAVLIGLYGRVACKVDGGDRLLLGRLGLFLAVIGIRLRIFIRLFILGRKGGICVVGCFL